MFKLVLSFMVLVLAGSSKDKKFLIVTGDISCKACVIQLQHYLQNRVRKGNLQIAFRDKGNFILNESNINYYKKELPKAHFIFLKDIRFFPVKEKFPYVLTILKQDTLKIAYDSLFVGEDLNVAYLK